MAPSHVFMSIVYVQCRMYKHIDYIIRRENQNYYHKKRIQIEALGAEQNCHLFDNNVPLCLCSCAAYLYDSHRVSVSFSLFSCLCSKMDRIKDVSIHAHSDIFITVYDEYCNIREWNQILEER